MDRRLHEVGRSDRAGGEHRLLVGGRTSYDHFEYASHALAVREDLLSQIGAEATNRVLKEPGVLAVRLQP